MNLYYQYESYDETERVWDGHRGHTVKTGNTLYRYVIYKKELQGPDSYHNSVDTEDEAIALISKAKDLQLRASFLSKHIEATQALDTLVALYEQQMKEALPLYIQCRRQEKEIDKIRTEYRSIYREDIGKFPNGADIDLLKTLWYHSTEDI